MGEIFRDIITAKVKALLLDSPSHWQAKIITPPSLLAQGQMYQRKGF